MGDIVTEIMCGEMDKDRKRIERLETEVRTLRGALEAALRYLEGSIRDDVTAPFQPKSKGFTGEYLNDLASMRAGRALLP